MSSANALKKNEEWCKVKGWLKPQVLPVLDAWRSCYGAYHKEFNITYDPMSDSSLEVGVHHGRLLLALEAITDTQSNVYGVDLFDLQQFNIDGSGRGNLSIFNDNVGRIAKYPNRVKPLPMDSFSLRTAKDLPHSYSLISIDGGHTIEHALHDLSYANDCLQPGGLIVLDDFPNINWLGVVEGAMAFLSSPTRRVAPFLVGYNKLFFTTISEASYLRHNMVEILSKNDEITVKRESTLSGHIVQALV